MKRIHVYGAQQSTQIDFLPVIEGDPNEIKVFIRTEQLADHNRHLSCIVTKMLHIFAAAGHHQYTKGTLLEPIK